MRNLSKISEQWIRYIYVFICAIILTLTLIFVVRQYNAPVIREWPFWQLATLHVLLCVLATSIFRYMRSFMASRCTRTLSKKAYYTIIASLLVGYFMIGLSWIIKSNLTILWDYRDIYNLASIYFQKGYLAAMNEPGITTPGLVVENLNYLDQFTNNLGLLFVIIGFGKIFGHAVFTYEVMNLCLVCLTLLLVWLLIQKLTHNRKIALIGLVAMMLFAPLLLYTPIFYTDVLVMPLVLGSMYLLIEENGEITQHKYKLVIVSILLGAAFIFRASFVILIIAVAIVFILRKKIAPLFLLVATCIMLSASFNFVVDQTGIYENRKEIGTPVWHWIAMAQNEYTLGQNYIYDYIDTFQMLHEKKPKAEISETRKKLFAQRVKEKGIGGNLVFNAKKISFLWGDPLYEAWHTYITDENDQPATENLFRRGVKSIGLYSYAKIYQDILYIGLCVIGFKKIWKKQGTAFDLIVMLSFIGFFFFYLIWEVHPRYLLCILPLWMSYFFIGLYTSENKQQQKIKT